MSFDTNQPIENIDKVQYNYSSTTFYKTQYQNTIKNSKYIKIPYTSKSNQPNIAIFGKGYITTSLCIAEPIHLIKNTYYTAELIIEHRSLTNYNEPLYTCFLLKSLITQEPNQIDHLIRGVDDTDLDLNSFLTKQKTIIFKNNLLKSATVIVFTNPIYINTVFERGSLKPGLNFLSPYVDTYSILEAHPILGDTDKDKSNQKEGLQNRTDDLTLPTDQIDTTNLTPPSNLFDDLTFLTDSTNTTPPSNEIPVPRPTVEKGVSIAGYCQPIDETDPSISQTAGIVIPINSELSKNKATDTTIKTLLNFFGFFVFIISAILITPVAHRILIVELIMDNEEFSAQRKLNRTSAADIYTATLLFGFSLAFINYGIINNKSTSTIIGFYCFIFVISSILVLQYHRISSPETYLNQFKTKGVLPSFENVEMDWNFFSDNISSLFYTKKMEPNPDPLTKATKPMVNTYHFSFGFVFFMIIYYSLYEILRRFKITGSGGDSFFTSIYTYLFLITIYFVALINHYRIVNQKLNQ